MCQCPFEGGGGAGGGGGRGRGAEPHNDMSVQDVKKSDRGSHCVVLMKTGKLAKTQLINTWSLRSFWPNGQLLHD